MSAKPIIHRSIASPLGPDYKSKGLSSLRSPQTITLGNQSANIARGMSVTTGPAMVTPSQSNKRFTQTAYQQHLPLLPNMPAMGEPSRPIRITRRKPVEVSPRQAAQPTEDLLSASPSELKLMYDEATWRMYHLIQTARMEKQAAKTPVATESSSAEQQWPNDQFLYDDSFFRMQSHHANTPPPTAMGMRPVVVSPEDDLDVEEDGEEGVFELEDL